MPGWITKKKEPVSTIPTLDPGQQQMADLLKKMLAGTQKPQDFLASMEGFLSKAGVGVTEPMPQAAAFDIPSMPTAQRLNIGAMPATPAITAGTAGVGLLGAGGVGGALGPDVTKALRDALSGRVSEEYFQSTVAGPATRTFREEIAPAIGEGFVGPGTFWGGAKGEAVERQGMRLAEGIAAARGQMSKEALDRQLQAALGYGEFQERAGTERAQFMAQNYQTWMSARSQDYSTWAQATGQSYDSWLKARSQDYNTWATTALGGYTARLGAESQRYATRQAGRGQDLSTYMQAYMQANPTHAETIGSILQYLNIPTLAAYQNPEYMPQAIQQAMRGGGTPGRAATWGASPRVPTGRVGGWR